MIDRAALARKQLAAEPIVSTWILNNAMLRDLQTLGIDKRKGEEAIELSPLEYAKEFDRQKAKKEKGESKNGN